MKIDISISEKLRNFISEATFTDIKDIHNDTLLFSEGLFDSLGFLSLISYLDEEFKIEVENDELVEENFESINAITAFIDTKRGIL